MRVYAYVALALIVVGGISYTHYAAYKSGKDSVVQKLQQDRIDLLKDGKKIDENVLSADDDGLLCIMLDNCKRD